MKCGLRASVSGLLKKAKAKICGRMGIKTKSRISSPIFSSTPIHVSTLEICVIPARPIWDLEDTHTPTIEPRSLSSSPTEQLGPINTSSTDFDRFPMKKPGRNPNILHRNPLRLNPVGRVTWQEEEVKHAPSDQGEQSDQDYHSVQESHGVQQSYHIPDSSRGQEEHSDQDYHSVHESRREDEYQSRDICREEGLREEEGRREEECRRGHESRREDVGRREEWRRGHESHHEEEGHREEDHNDQEDGSDVSAFPPIPFHQRSMEETQRYDLAASRLGIWRFNPNAERVHRSPLHLDSQHTTIWDGGFSPAAARLVNQRRFPRDACGQVNTAAATPSEIASISEGYEARGGLRPMPSQLSVILEEESSEEMQPSLSGTTLQSADTDGTSVKSGVSAPRRLGRKSSSRDLRGAAAAKRAPAIRPHEHHRRARLSPAVSYLW